MEAHIFRNANRPSSVETTLHETEWHKNQPCDCCYQTDNDDNG